MKILVIDDDSLFGATLKFFFEKRGNAVEVVLDPEMGIQKIDHSFDLVFIDFKFDNSETYDGAKVCKEIKGKCPLVTRILTSAFGNEDETIIRYIYVGFHHYLPKKKPGEPVQVYNARIIKTAEEAKERAQSEYVTEFHEKDLVTVVGRLNGIQTVMEFMENNEIAFNNYAITAGLYLLEAKRPLDVKILRGIKQAKNKAQFIADNDLKDFRNISKFFQLKIKDKDYTENALKVRYVLMRDANPYKMAKNYYGPVNKIKKEFKLN